MSSTDTSRGDAPRIMNSYTKLHYEHTVTQTALRAAKYTREGKLVGQKCHVCGLIYVPVRDYCPIDVVRLDESDDVQLAEKGTVINYTVVTPVPYPGQKATEPFARVQIALDEPGGSVQLQDLIEVPVADVRVGMRVEAVWRPAKDRNEEGAGGGWGVGGGLEGWIPTGEPDADPSTLTGGSL